MANLTACCVVCLVLFYFGSWRKCVVCLVSDWPQRSRKLFKKSYLQPSNAKCLQPFPSSMDIDGFSSILMDHPWIIWGYPWIIHGYPWTTYGYHRFHDFCCSGRRRRFVTSSSATPPHVKCHVHGSKIAFSPKTYKCNLQNQAGQRHRSCKTSKHGAMLKILVSGCLWAPDTWRQMVGF